MKFEMELKSLDSTKKVAEAISINLKPNDFVLLSGNLGAGKTTFTRFLIKCQVFYVKNLTF